MKTIKSLFICALLSLACHFKAHASLSDNDWDYFVYTQQWPQGACTDAKSENHTCVIPANTTTWSVHGLWPDKKNTLGPNFCNKTDVFNLSLIEELIPQMKQYWPNFFTDTPFDSFWKHEWDKHGTCAKTVEKVKGEYNYFSTGLKLNRQYDLLNLFKEQGIVPDATKTYNASDLLAAAKAALKHDVQVRCTYDHATKLHQLFEIEMCLDKQVSPIDCPEHRLQQSESCPLTKPIYYMPIQHEPSASPAIKQVLNAKVKPAWRREEVPEKQRVSNDEAHQMTAAAQWSVASEITQADEQRMKSKSSAGEEFVMEEESGVAVNGREAPGQDTKLLFQAYHEEKRNDESNFDDIWRKIVDDILEE